MGHGLIIISMAVQIQLQCSKGHSHFKPYNPHARGGVDMLVMENVGLKTTVVGCQSAWNDPAEFIHCIVL